MGLCLLTLLLNERLLGPCPPSWTPVSDPTFRVGQQNLLVGRLSVQSLVHTQRFLQSNCLQIILLDGWAVCISPLSPTETPGTGDKGGDSFPGRKAQFCATLSKKP